MPPRRRTFYLADATLLSNPKIRGLTRREPERWVAVIGAFHVLIGVATLNGSPRLTRQEITDTLGDGHDDLIDLLRAVGLMTPTGISRSTFEDWCPKARPQYPSDKKPRGNSGGNGTDSGGVGPDSGGVGTDSGGIPTSSSSSGSSALAASSSSSRGGGRSAGERNGLKALNGDDAIKALDAAFAEGRIDGVEYHRQREAMGAA